MQNVTKDRVEKLLAVKFDDLPLHDAFTIVKGEGKRKLAIFEDPRCGYCKRFERDLQKIDNVSIHVFLYPVLGPESVDKSKAIWCSKDPAGAWSDWMQKDLVPVAKSEPCNTAVLNRNLDFGQKYKIEGTPTLILADGTRVPGAIDAKKLESLLAAQDTKVR
jgi:thiol:disulfide interchange protein DsbC